jgi:hypothetical protein
LVHVWTGCPKRSDIAADPANAGGGADADRRIDAFDAVHRAQHTLAFADVASSRRSSAATLSSMLQQVAMLFGVAVAAALLNLSQIARGGPALDLVDFRLAFLAIGAIGFAASFRYLALPPAAGAEVSGHLPRN